MTKKELEALLHQSRQRTMELEYRVAQLLSEIERLRPADKSCFMAIPAGCILHRTPGAAPIWLKASGLSPNSCDGMCWDECKKCVKWRLK